MLFMIIGGVFVAYVSFVGFRLVRLIKKAKAMARTTQPYERHPRKTSRHILILGDSTMYGAGIDSPENTIGGLIAGKYPKASIETLAINGARIRNLRGQLKQAQYKHYDLIIIGIGGNDVMRFSNYAVLEQELGTFLNEASGVAERIVLCHSVNIGNIGFFTFPLNYLFDYRSRRLSQMYASMATSFASVLYVNFYRPMHDDHYDKTTRKSFVASDAFHANDYANQYFFDIIWSEMERSDPALS